jgi:hypothetical protein
MTHNTPTLLLILLCAIAQAASGTATQVSETKNREPRTAVSEIGPDAITIPRMINYQGKLTDASGNPITGTKSMTFKLWDVLSGGTTPLWTETQSVVVTDGVFNVLLGSSTPIPGSAVLQSGTCYLEIIVEGVPIIPRTQLVSVPYAYKADTADYAANAPLARPITPAVATAEIADGNVTMAKIAQAGASPGQVIKWQGSVWAPGPDVADAAWIRPDPADSVLYTIHRLGIARGDASNALLGNNRHTHTNLGTFSTTGALGQDYDFCTVTGGLSNIAGNRLATVGGGYANFATGDWATIAGGDSNSALGTGAFVGGGDTNSASGQRSVVSGGGRNSASGNYAAVGGGQSNTATAGYVTVGGGHDNTAIYDCATVGGGACNTASNDCATVAGGYNNTASGYPYPTIGGGSCNTAGGGCATVGGGGVNDASSPYATISGGYSNYVSGLGATVGGGEGNIATRDYSTVPGGWRAAATLFGQQAHASGYFQTPGDAQTSLYVLRLAGESGELYLDGSSAQLTLANNRSLAFTTLVVARDGSDNSKAWRYDGLVMNIGGSAVLIGTPTVTGPWATAGASAWTFALGVTSTGLTLTGGDASSDTRWVATVWTTEVNQ